MFHRTGRLAFEITTGLGISTKWEDSEKARVEERLPEILRSFLLGAMIQKQDIQQRQSRAARMAEAARVREIAVREQEKEAARWSALVRASATWHEANAVRSFVEELTARMGSTDEAIEGKPASEWLEWARRRMDEMDPFTEGTMAALRHIFGKS